MSNLNELKRSILADGIIDEQEVKQLREVLYADGIIDKEEAEFLFELNDAVSGKNNHQSWNEFFIEAICDYLLKDEVSPGVVDEDEASWLITKVNNDGIIDNLELELLKALIAKAKEVPTSLSKLVSN